MRRRIGIGKHVGKIAFRIYRERARIVDNPELSRDSADISHRNNAGCDGVGGAVIGACFSTRLPVVIQAAFHRIPGQLNQLEVLTELIRDESLMSHTVDYRQSAGPLPDRFQEAQAAEATRLTFPKLNA